MGPHRRTNRFDWIDAEQFGSHPGTNHASLLNRSTVEPLGLKRPNWHTAVNKAAVFFSVLQLEQSRCGSGSDDPLLLDRRAVHQLLDRNFRGGEQRTPFVTDSPESEN